MPTYSRQAMQALVESSPAAVASHDKPAWTGLFGRHSRVEDPVGSQPVNAGNTDSIGRFYDTFIAPNRIRFEVHRDYAGPQSILRDLTIHIEMTPAVAVSVPMHLLYEIGEENGELKISRLAAHWELLPMLGQLLAKGVPAVHVSLSLTVRMFRQLGLAGVVGFSRAALTPRGKHYRLLDQLLTAINCQDHSAVKGCFASEELAVTDSNAQKLPLASLKGISASKRIAAGRWITASVKLAGTPAVLVGEICPDRHKLLRCELYR